MKKIYYTQLQQLFDANHNNPSFDISLFRALTQQNVEAILAFENHMEIIRQVFKTVQRECMKDLILYLQKLAANSMYQMAI